MQTGFCFVQFEIVTLKKYEETLLLVFNAMSFRGSELNFRKNSLPSSGTKSKTRNLHDLWRLSVYLYGDQHYSAFINTAVKLRSVHSGYQHYSASKIYSAVINTAVRWWALQWGEQHDPANDRYSSLINTTVRSTNGTVRWSILHFNWTYSAWSTLQSGDQLYRVIGKV
jgi:hypothetical protein